MNKSNLSIYALAFLLLSSSLIAHWEEIENEWEGQIDEIFIVNNYLFISTYDENFENDQLFVSTDDGDSFSNITENLPDSVQSFTPHDITYHKGEIFMAIGGNIYASSNLGTTWRQIDHSVELSGGLTAYYRVISLESDGEVLYAGTDEFTTGFVIKSENDGGMWELAHSTSFSGVKQIIATDSYIYFGTEVRLYRSELNSTEWEEILSGGDLNFAVNSQGNDLIVKKEDGIDSLLISNDYGDNFSASEQISGNFIFNPAYSQGTFLVQVLQGFSLDIEEGIIYRNASTNNEWMSLSGEQYLKISWAMEANDQYLFIQYGDTLITRTHLSHFGITTSVDQPEQVSFSFELNQNYPNPFNPSTTISYSIPKQSNVSLKVYDMLGREVAELVNSEKAAGSYEVNFNASALSSGVYFYKIKAGNYVQSRKMLLLK